jgi:hypothetical protein
MLDPPLIGVVDPAVMRDRKALAREIAARTKPRFIEIPPKRRGKYLTEAEQKAMRGGLTAEKYRAWLIKTFLVED